jgi:hypothetical protein
MLDYRNFYKLNVLLDLMKRVFVALMFLMLVGGALAMTAPIRIQAEAGNEVRFTARNSTTGAPMGNYKETGIADENGLFETRIYSLLGVDGVEYHVRTFSGLTLLQEGRFDASAVSEPLLLDCTSECVSSTYELVVEEELVAVEEVINETAEEVVEESVVEDESVVESSEEVGVTGRAIFTNEDGSINWIYVGGGGVLVLVLLILLIIFIVSHSKKKGGKEVVAGKKDLDDDEKELEEMEKKVKDTEDKIKGVKDKKERRTKIYNAKVKLAEEERELKELEDGGDKARVEKQEDVVDKAEDKVDDAETQA